MGKGLEDVGKRGSGWHRVPEKPVRISSAVWVWLIKERNTSSPGIKLKRANDIKSP